MRYRAGVADAELAKRAAQKETESRGRRLRDDEKELESGTSRARSTQNRRISPSYDSAASGRSMSPASPSPRRESMSPQRAETASLQRRSDSPRKGGVEVNIAILPNADIHHQKDRCGNHSDTNRMATERTMT
ncbi:hypothetical protein PspLS_05418 [Pyricularia sp. CBS 133598]|nr:hypothetical protein PspLS_05418 [Pyricularia sp. CBS 133598]